MKFLVYLPCHSDFGLAVKQAKSIKEDFKRFSEAIPNTRINLEIVLSVNAYLPNAHEKKLAEAVCDKVIYNGIGVLRDINIANGFLVALDRKPDIFWLLSANDTVVRGAVGIILTSFIEDSALDLLVASVSTDSVFVQKQIIDPPARTLYYGVITGVVYRLERLNPYLHNGPCMSWVGWPHLAVMQSAMDSLGGLRVKSISRESIFHEGERDIETIRQFGYSIYGMLILGSVFKSTNGASRKFIRSYVFSHFYDWHMYCRNYSYSGQLINENNYLGWNQKIAESLIWKTSPFVYTFYKIVKNIPFRRIRKLQRKVVKTIKR
jgi:hypothetical protein